jgi:hypothetical protein
MTIKASRPAAWILAAGLLACGLLACMSASFAAEDSPWPAVNTVVTAQPSADGQQPATADQPAATDPTAAQQQQPDGTDRSLSAEQRPADAMAAAETADANTAQAASNSDQGSGSDKASIVGKIFIAAGTLLTLGSAARMFMV